MPLPIHWNGNRKSRHNRVKTADCCFDRASYFSQRLDAPDAADYRHDSTKDDLTNGSKQHIKASISYFAIVIGTGFLLGLIRVPLLVPRLGERYAELLEMPIMLGVIVLGARFIVRRFQLPAQLWLRLQVGMSALMLSVAAELLLATVLQDRTVAQYIASRDPVSGSVYLLLLMVFALMPALLGESSRRAGQGRHP